MDIETWLDEHREYFPVDIFEPEQSANGSIVSVQIFENKVIIEDVENG